jgi:ribose transport system substrate-binding protein
MEGTVRVSRVASLVAVFALAGVSITTSPIGAAVGRGAPSSQKSDAALAAATKATNAAFKGTYRSVDGTPRAAVKGKHLAIISAGQASISAQIPVAGAADAVEAIGWQADVYDGKLAPGTYPGLVRQAIAAGVDGIVLVAIDCQAVSQPLQEARAKGIAIIGLGSFDCNDPHGGGAKKGLFSAQLNFGPRGDNLDELVASYGADQANYIVSKSKNRARIIMVSDPEFTTLYYTDQGFEKTIAKSGGSKIVSKLEVTTADFVGSGLVAKIQAELLRHPEATWIRSPYTYATTLGIVPALGAQAGKIDVMGGEGYEPELDLLRDGKITAVNIFASDWEGWAAIDTMNSVFRKTPPVDSGLGWVMADAQHNVPASGSFDPRVDYRSQYRKAWAVT